MRIKTLEMCDIEKKMLEPNKCISYLEIARFVPISIRTMARPCQE